MPSGTSGGSPRTSKTSPPKRRSAASENSRADPLDARARAGSDPELEDDAPGRGLVVHPHVQRDAVRLVRNDEAGPESCRTDRGRWQGVGRLVGRAGDERDLLVRFLQRDLALGKRAVAEPGEGASPLRNHEGHSVLGAHEQRVLLTFDAADDARRGELRAADEDEWPDDEVSRITEGLPEICLGM